MVKSQRWNKKLKLINSLSYSNSPNDCINCRLIPNDWDKEVTCILGSAEGQNFLYSTIFPWIFLLRRQSSAVKKNIVLLSCSNKVFSGVIWWPYLSFHLSTFRVLKWVQQTWHLYNTSYWINVLLSMLLRFPCLFTKLFPACEMQSAFIQTCKPCLAIITPFHQCHLSDVSSTQHAECPPTAQLILPSPLQLRGTFWDLGLTQCLWRAGKKSLTFCWKKPSTGKLQSLKVAAKQAEVGQSWCYLQTDFSGSGE